MPVAPVGLDPHESMHPCIDLIGGSIVDLPLVDLVASGRGRCQAGDRWASWRTVRPAVIDCGNRRRGPNCRRRSVRCTRRSRDGRRHGTCRAGSPSASRICRGVGTVLSVDGGGRIVLAASAFALVPLLVHELPPLSVGRCRSRSLTLLTDGGQVAAVAARLVDCRLVDVEAGVERVGDVIIAPGSVSTPSAATQSPADVVPAEASRRGRARRCRRRCRGSRNCRGPSAIAAADR